jgi:phage tail-like protein
MPVLSGERPPYGSFHFRVLLSESGRETSGFCEVVFPEFPVQKGTVRNVGTEPADDPTTLVLRRGFDGTLDLYEWWNQTRRPRKPRAQTVTVELLEAARGQSVVFWTFTGCRPVRLAYSPLDAQTSAVLVETLELSFEDMQMTRGPGSGRRQS